MNKRKIEVLILRVSYAILLIFCLSKFIDIFALQASIFSWFSGIFGVCIIIFDKINEAQDVFEDNLEISHELDLELRRTMDIRISSIRFDWWVSIISSFVVVFLGLLMEKMPEIPYREIIYSTCYTLIVANCFIAVSFVSAHFDCRDALRELKGKKRDDAKYGKSVSDISKLPSICPPDQQS